MRIVSRPALSCTLAALSLLGAGFSPAAGAKVRAGTFVAALSTRPPVHLAIVTDGRLATAYRCGGTGRPVWFDGRFRGARATLRARRGRGLIRLRTAGRALAGSLLLNGKTTRFRATRARGQAGLWRASALTPDAGTVVAAWVVLANGRQAGGATIGNSTATAPALNLAEPDVTIAGVGLTALQLDPPDLFPFDVSPRRVTILASGPRPPGGETVVIIRDGIADVGGVTVKIGGLTASLRPRQPGSDQLPVRLPGGIAAGLHDVSVKIPGQAELVRRNVLEVIISP
jgi:hypothetical protein